MLGWALVVAKVALAVEVSVKSRLAAPSSLGNRIGAPFALTGSSLRAVDDDTIQARPDVRAHDKRGRPGYVADQLIMRFRDTVTGERCDAIIRTQGTRKLRMLDVYRNLYLLELTAPQQVSDAIDQFDVLAEVEYAVPNVLYYQDLFVSCVRTSMYFSVVLRITSAGSRGPGGCLSQSSVSR